MNQEISKNTDNQSVEFFLHSNNSPQVVRAKLEETLRDVLVKLDFPLGEGRIVFIGEAEDGIHSPNDESDAHQPTSVDSSIESLELHKHKHVHVSAVHRVNVTVSFNGVNHQRHFSPATTIATVTSWSKLRFHIDPSSGADLILALKPNDEHPRPDQHLGELLQRGSCELVFDLVREITPQG